MTSRLRALGWPDDDDDETCEGDGDGRAEPIAGRYALVHPIGEGGTSTVWRARDLRTKSDVALKLMSRSSADGGRLLERFRRELELTSQLAGPSYVQVLDSGVVFGRAFLVMELLEGESLHRRLRRIQTMSGRELLELCGGLHEALSHAHAMEIVHRDIKPANIFYERTRTPSGPRNFVKLLDLGIARALRSEARLTTTNTFLGSPHYMSPEQLRSGRGVGACADLWSTSVVLYRALTGALPFEGAGIEATKRIATSSFLPPSVISRGELRAFDAFFARAFDPARSGRFQNIDDLAAGFVTAVLASPLFAPAGMPEAGFDPRSTVIGPVGYAQYAVRATTNEPDERDEKPTVVAEVGVRPRVSRSGR